MYVVCIVSCYYALDLFTIMFANAAVNSKIYTFAILNNFWVFKSEWVQKGLIVTGASDCWLRL